MMEKELRAQGPDTAVRPVDLGQAAQTRQVHPGRVPIPRIGSKPALRQASFDVAQDRLLQGAQGRYLVVRFGMRNGRDGLDALRVWRGQKHAGGAGDGRGATKRRAHLEQDSQRRKRYPLAELRYRMPQGFPDGRGVRGESGGSLDEQVGARRARQLAVLRRVRAERHPGSPGRKRLPDGQRQEGHAPDGPQGLVRETLAPGTSADHHKRPVAAQVVCHDDSTRLPSTGSFGKLRTGPGG